MTEDFKSFVLTPEMIDVIVKSWEFVRFTDENMEEESPCRKEMRDAILKLQELGFPKQECVELKEGQTEDDIDYEVAFKYADICLKVWESFKNKWIEDLDAHSNMPKNELLEWVETQEKESYKLVDKFEGTREVLINAMDDSLPYELRMELESCSWEDVESSEEAEQEEIWKNTYGFVHAIGQERRGVIREICAYEWEARILPKLLDKHLTLLNEHFEEAYEYHKKHLQKWSLCCAMYDVAENAKASMLEPCKWDEAQFEINGFPCPAFRDMERYVQTFEKEWLEWWKEVILHKDEDDWEYHKRITDPLI